jgi:alkylhydroperoxidase/carboxymuconolactone decarboxylase family protein YurZ
MMSDSTDILSAIAYGDGAALETLTEMNLNTLEASGLDSKTYTMVRIAALVAMDAPHVAYPTAIEAAMEVLESEDIQGVLVALAPVVGSAKIASGSSNILDAYFDLSDGDQVVEVANDADESSATQMVGQVSEYDVAEDEDEVFADEEHELETV